MTLGPLNPTCGVVYANITPISSTTGGWSGTNCAQPPSYTVTNESETVEFPYAQTVSAANSATTQGGFQIVAGSAAGTAMSRVDH